MSNTIQMIAAIAAAVIELAVVAVVVSGNSNTANVIKSAAGGFGYIIAAAVKPVTGGTLGGYQGASGSQLGNSPGLYLA